MSKHMEEFDLVVVGSGVGLTVVSQALNHGWKVALVEDSKFGGTCLTRGCIPSKVLVYPADVIREAEHASAIGISFSPIDIDWNKITQRMWSQIDESKQIEQSLSTAPSLKVFKGIGEFTGTYEMQVKLNATGKFSNKITGKRFVLASGGRSFVPPISGLTEVGYITTETFFGSKFPKKPWKSLTIIGGGVIAAEFAHIFSAMGTKVTIVEMLPRLVPTEEPEISQILKSAFEKHLTVYTHSKAVSVRKKDGLKVLTVENLDTHTTLDVTAEEILVAAGRQSNADWLQTEKAGIAMNNSNWINTNEFLETNVPNIWAIGDANGKFQFRHKANHDAEILTRNLFGQGEKSPVDYSAVPWAIFTYPQIAHVGLTEQEAISQGYRIYTATKTYSSVAKGFAMGLTEKDGLFKLVVNEDYRILGAHAIGPQAATLIQQIVYLMNAGFSCSQQDGFDIAQSDVKAAMACPEAGSFMPIYRSMVIHPSLNEVAGWALGNLRPVNISPHNH
ncbi:MAG: dihydrolipoyl dehydrogenase [Promethearchaeota archaeon]|nr:MAG: dihydrolipoyl dehydrogenase [Candidatus Lokiarchaeota archaeon]